MTRNTYTNKIDEKLEIRNDEIQNWDELENIVRSVAEEELGVKMIR